MAYYNTSTARKIDAATFEPVAFPLFTPVEGGKYDRDLRRSAQPSMVGVLAYVAAIVLVLFIAGGITVAVTSGTVGRLASNKSTQAQIEELSEFNSELRIERSMLRGADRISKLAEQNLGMVYASDARTLELE
ncbi:MAG: hypothetical protein U0J70_03625 [Atopobiaceae bacterium]|jgi:cell division protein FtsL|nr:hypothetical protein [Atopobiaceae bacterium]